MDQSKLNQELQICYLDNSRFDPFMSLFKFKPATYIHNEHLSFIEIAADCFVPTVGKLICGTATMYERVIELSSSDVAQCSDEMKLLATSDGVNDVTEIIACLAAACQLWKYPFITRSSQEQIATLHDPERLAAVVGGYAYLVCLVNPSFDAASFAEIYAKAVFEYYERCDVFMEHLVLDGANWRQSFESCLILAK